MITGSDIAFRIRAELVCCRIYNRVNTCKELTLDEAMASKDWHDICYWGEAAAQIAEGNCPGYETKPNICQCPCQGCKHNCGAHQEAPSDIPEEGMECICGDQVTWMTHPTEPGWIHTPGSDTACLDARLRCPRCRVDHPLVPGPVTHEKPDAVDLELDRRIEAAVKQPSTTKDPVPALEARLRDANAKIQRMSRSVPALQRALEELPLTCRYHGVRLVSERPVRGHEACCDTGEPALRRQMATRALEALKAELSNEG